MRCSVSGSLVEDGSVTVYTWFVDEVFTRRFIDSMGREPDDKSQLLEADAPPAVETT